MTTHLHLDTFAGIAGDMFLGACIDLGAQLDDITKALSPIKTEFPYKLSAKSTTRHSIHATNFTVHITKPKQNANHKHHDHHDHQHNHHTNHHDIMQMIDALDTTPRAKERARAIITALAKAEAHVHNSTIEEIQFHEVGAVDSIVDILGSAVALELLNVDTISSTPLPLGHGFVKCAHGTLPLPAPATAFILRDIPTLGVDRKGETVTPTGAAIVAALCQSFGPQPPMNVKKIGYGAGDRDDPDLPNMLRTFLGQPLSL